MTERAKISPAFEPFLARSGPHDKRDAIVIYRVPGSEDKRPRGRLRILKQRLEYVEKRSAAQRPIEKQLLQGYEKEVGGQSSRSAPQLMASHIGTGALPVATVEITPRTLSALAEQPNVVAILPNQKIQLIKPKEVDYTELSKQENKDGLTWGLKRLGIPELWKTTKGQDINVAVLDTGVYGDHGAL